MYYYAIGYLMPALIVAIAFMLSPENYGTTDYCWINVRTSTVWAFVGPVTAILIFNTGVLFIALRTVLSVQNRDRSLADRVLGNLNFVSFQFDLFRLVKRLRNAFVLARHNLVFWFLERC
jgi:hypothetical protein